jgi:hypothetical protein
MPKRISTKYAFDNFNLKKDPYKLSHPDAQIQPHCAQEIIRCLLEDNENLKYKNTILKNRNLFRQ